MVKIGVLAVTYLNATAALQPEIVSILPDTTGYKNTIELEEIEVGATRAPYIFPDVARIVQVMTKDDLIKKPARSLPEALRQFHAVDIRQRGPEGIQADISMRGGSFDQTAILFNGINISDPQTGHHNLNIPVSFSNIDRIEILEGPAARIYGPNAFSGAVNIITKTGESNSVEAFYSRGSFNFSDFEVLGSLNTGKFNHSVAFNRKKSHGYINNTDFDVHNYFYQSSAEFNPGKIDIQFGYTVKQFGANAFYTPRFPDQYEQTKTMITSIRYNTQSKINLTPAVYWRRHHDRFELFRYEHPEWYSGHNFHLTDVFGSTLNSWFITALGKTSLGTEIRTENIWSNVLGDKLSTNIEVPGEDAWFSRYKSRTNFSFFAEHNINLNQFFLSAGILVQRITHLDLDWKFYPGIDLSYNFTPEIKWFTSFGKSLRLPTFTDLYYSGPTNIGNAELKPEETFQYETGIKYYSKGFRGHLNLYSQKGINLIDWVKLPGEEIWKTANHTTIRSTGYQVFIKFDFNSLINKNFPVSTISAGYNFNDIHKNNTDIISYYVLDNLRHKLTFNLDHDISKYFHSSWSFIYQHRNGSYSLYTINNQIIETAYEPFGLIDWKLSYTASKIELFLSVNNLLNGTYIDYGNIEQPGRWIKTGLRVKIR